MLVATSWRQLAVCAALLASAGCAETIEEADDPRSADRQPIYVVVDNYHSLDVNVHALGAGDGRIRLGTARGLSNARFRIPDGLGTQIELRLMADPIGVRDPLVTDPIHVSPGDEINWRLNEPLRVSSYTLRSRVMR